MKKFLYTLIATIVAINFLCVPILADNEVQTTSVYVTSEIGLNVRTFPQICEETLIESVPYGTELEKVKDSATQGWTMVKYESRYRYVCSVYLTDNAQDIVVEEPAPADNLTYYGNCRITHYCNCSACCGQWAGGATASGAMPSPNWTVACGDLPFGTKLLINGQTYCVEDRGVGGQQIDIYCASHDEACARGLYYTDVYIIN